MMNGGSANLVTISSAAHSRYVAMALRNLFDSKRGTDFNLRLGGKSVAAHRLILDLFLAPELTGTVQDELSFATAVKQEVLDDGCGSDCNILDFVMEFLYKGEVDVPEQQLENLLGVAKELDFQMLIDAVQVCKPVDIITGDELNLSSHSDAYCSDNANEIKGSPIEDAKYNRETFGNPGSYQPNKKREITLKPFTVNSGALVGVPYPISRTKINGDGLESQDLKMEPENESVDSKSGLDDDAESLREVLSGSGSDEEGDGGAALDDSLHPGTSSNPCQQITKKRAATKMYKCRHCKFETPINDNYRKHCLSAHQRPMPEEQIPLRKCPKCDFTSIYSNSIKSHLSTIHSEARNHACPQCSYAGKQKSNLKRHMNLVHGVGDSLFTCKVCRKNFTSPSTLERHSRVHTNERPFKCHLCSYAAKDLYNLKIHMKTIHNEGDSCFTCEMCGKRCSSRFALVRHTRTHTAK